MTTRSQIGFLLSLVCHTAVWPPQMERPFIVSCRRLRSAERGHNASDFYDVYNKHAHRANQSIGMESVVLSNPCLGRPFDH